MASVRPASSLILCKPLAAPASRTAKGQFKVLMVKRSARGSFKSLHVYPGGAVDNADGDTSANAYKLESDPWQLDPHTQTHLLPFRIAAIRETFEESGVLVGATAEHQTRLADSRAWRNKVLNDAAQFAEMARSIRWNPPLNRLVHWSHWITPVVEKKRFDTHFFLTTVDSEASTASQEGVDGSELVHLEWLTPSEALHAFATQKISLFPPQYLTLMELSRYTFLELEDYVHRRVLRESEFLIPNQPEPYRCEEDGAVLVYPGDVQHSMTRSLAETTFKRLSPGAKNRIRFSFADGSKSVTGFDLIATGGNDAFGALPRSHARL
ncbi:hypothetical protein BJ741DRAFT_611024 [Chytriomyces cf. hyalinus JEL632]|nr:hypothetical protein BJ741DRAFT_611024 [Chytriomyces cf. hyalinus JEL632]